MQIIDCEDCGISGKQEQIVLHQVFTLDYKARGYEVDERAHLCEHCHQERHMDICGEYWEDTTEKASFWQGFEKACIA